MSMGRNDEDFGTRDARVEPHPTGNLHQLVKVNRGRNKKKAKRPAGHSSTKSRAIPRTVPNIPGITVQGNNRQKHDLPKTPVIEEPESEIEAPEITEPDEDLSDLPPAASSEDAYVDGVENVEAGDGSSGEESAEEVAEASSQAEAGSIEESFAPLFASKGITSEEMNESWDGNKYATYGTSTRAGVVGRSIVNDDQIPGHITLALPAPIRAKYMDDKSRLKNNHDQPLREYLIHRLDRCKDHSDNGVFLNERVLREIGRVAHRNFNSPEELLGWIMSSYTQGDGKNNVNLHIDPDLVERVRVRKTDDQDLGDAITEYAEFGIMVKTGML